MARKCMQIAQNLVRKSAKLRNFEKKEKKSGENQEGKRRRKGEELEVTINDCAQERMGRGKTSNGVRRLSKEARGGMGGGGGGGRRGCGHSLSLVGHRSPVDVV